ncbi:MAG: GMP synthase [Microscillaceae bacterium]|jgi:GMP synthase-like glutamine amidotransferase|nr:GMP synthase [Microscillaceae bacterium]
MEKIKVAILDLYNGIANQGMRNIKDIIARQSNISEVDLEYHVYDVRGKAEVPNLDHYDIYISTGGPGSPFEGLGQDWETNYFKWIDTLWDFNLKNTYHKKYGFFICHSFQMICRHFELGKVCKRRSTSFGVFPIHKTLSGEREMFFDDLPDPMFGVDNRDWQVIELNKAKIQALGAEILALEKIRPHIDLERSLMAIRLSNEVFATQFHPEADPDGMMVYLKDDAKRQQIFEHHGEEKYYEMLHHLNDPDKIRLTQKTIIPNFLAQSIEATQKVFL